MTPPFTGPFNAEYASDNGTAFVVDSCGNPVPPEWIAARLNAAAPAPSVAQSERETFEKPCPECECLIRDDKVPLDFYCPGCARQLPDGFYDKWQARASAGSATVDADTIAKQIVDEWAGLYCDDGSRLDPKWQEIAAIITAHTHSAPPALREAGATEGDIFAGYVCRDVAELPNRTSPEDAPDMMLVTADELTDIILRHLRRAG